MKKIISDASPLIFMAKADLIGTFKKIYKKCYVTPYIKREIEKPIELGYNAPEIKIINDADILIVEKLTAKEIVEAKKLASKCNIGMGEAEAGILFKKGGFETVIVADIRAYKKLKELGVSTLDLVDVGFVAAEKNIINPRQFANKLYEKGHYRTERILNILGR